MIRSRWLRWAYMATTGGVMLQIAGCTTTEGLEFLQTIFLGITAAGAYAILQNL